MRTNIAFFILLAVLFLALGSCKLGQGGGNGETPETNTPSITSILPHAIFANSPSFTLFINGLDFTEDSLVYINQQSREPLATSDTTITCQVGPEDWVQTETLRVTVANQGGGKYKFSNQMEVPILRTGFIRFTTPQQIAQLSSISIDYQDIETDNQGNIYVVYENIPADQGEIFLVHSPDYGDTWELPINVSNTDLYSDYPDLAVGPNRDLFITWWGSDDPNAEESYIYFSRSTDQGKTWQTPKRVFPDYNKSDDPRICVDVEGAVNMVFSNREGEYDDPIFYFGRSTDNGGTWNAVQVDEGEVMVQFPLEEDQNGNLHTAYVKYNADLYGFDLYYASSTDHGLTWNPALVSHEISVFRGHVFPAIGFGEGDNVYVTWNYDLTHRSGSRRVSYFARSLTNGETWEPEIELDEVVYNCGGDKSDMVVDSQGNILVVMSYIYLFLARSSDGGQTWTPPMFIKKSEQHAHPCMTIDNQDNLIIAWSDNSKIYFCKNRR